MDVVATKCRVIKSHNGKAGNELSLEIGDIITVLRKGKYIWYGQLDKAKGFFPIENVEVVDDSVPIEKPESPLSSAAVVDKKSDGASLAVSDLKVTKEAFSEIEVTSPLEDKRRSRPRSAGRPPSQVFMKENKLLRSQSTTDTLDVDSDDSMEQMPETNEKQNTVSTKMAAVSQLVLELKQKPQMKAVIQNDVVTTTTTTTTENPSDVPAWMKALPKKKPSISNLVKTVQLSDSTPPWMKEVRQKREHKLSLRGDEMTKKETEESRTHQLEVYSFTSRSTDSVLSTENIKVETKSIDVGSKAETLVSTNKSAHSYFPSNGISPISPTTTAKNLELALCIEKPSELTRSINTTTSRTSEIIKIDNSTIHKNTQSIKKPEDKATDIKTPTETSAEKINEQSRGLEETPSVTPTVTLHAQVTVEKSQKEDNKKIATQISVENAQKADTKKIATEAPLLQNSERKDVPSLKPLLEKLEKLEAKSKSNYTQMEKELLNMQLLLKQQYTEMTAAIQEIKSTLSISIQSDN